MGFTEKGNPERMTAQEPFGGALLQGPLQKREGVRDTPRQCICVAQIRSDERRPTRNDLRDRLGTFEHGYGSGKVAFSEANQAGSSICTEVRTADQPLQQSGSIVLHT